MKDAPTLMMYDWSQDRDYNDGAFLTKDAAYHAARDRMIDVEGPYGNPKPSIWFCSYVLNEDGEPVIISEWEEQIDLTEAA